MSRPLLAGWLVRDAAPRAVEGLLADAAQRGVVLASGPAAARLADPGLLVIAPAAALHAAAWRAYAALLGPRVERVPLVLVMPRTRLLAAVACGDDSCPVTRVIAGWTPEPAAIPGVVLEAEAHHVVRLVAPVNTPGGAA